jgi:epoxyqueuosine reductase
MAEAAGLGFFGKNSCLIDPSRGSGFFIAVILTTATLEPTAVRAMPNCGDCTRCGDACPTGAIVSPGMIDARRCVSWLTIENKGCIPEEFRPLMGNRLFGCDSCQDCCPFNVTRAHRQEVRMKELLPDGGAGGTLPLTEVLSMDEAGFLKRFSGTPLTRAKWRGFLRNACVVAGNSGDRSLIPLLEKVAGYDDPMLVQHALWAITQLQRS